jgi:hypothetical protein
MDLLEEIKKIDKKFVDSKFENEILLALTNLFPNLNKNDKEYLLVLTIFTVDLISFKYHFEKKEEYYNQWRQNNYRDIKSVILLLLPFINDENDSYLLKKITDLNQFLYAYNDKYIPFDILKNQRERILSTNFEFGNMGIGLLPRNNNSEKLLDLYENDMKTIYKIIHHNFIGLLKTLDIINGKSYVNWINIIPLNLNDYIDSNIYKSTENRIAEIRNNNSSENIKTILTENLYKYNGLWLGDIYNVLRVRYYEEAKKIKWLFFPYETTNKSIYLIHGLNIMFDLNNIINSNFNNYNDLPLNQQIVFENKVKSTYMNITQNISIIENIELDYTIIRYLLIYIINNTNLHNINNGILKKFKLDDIQENEIKDNNDFTQKDTTKILNITNNDIIECFNLIKTEYLNNLWTFLKTSINDLRETAYYKFLIKDNMIIENNYYYKPFNQMLQNDNFKMNIKNIYNIAKKLSHDVNWNLNNRNFISLTENQQAFVFLSLFSNNTSWLNLNSNMKRQKIGVQYNYNTEITNILSAFKQFVLPIIFEELITMGVLNRFDLALEITNKEILPEKISTRKRKITELIKKRFNTNREKWENSYYYLTNDIYKNLDKIRQEKSNQLSDDDKYDEYNYFNLIAEKQEWMIFYAMDWISQISFFQHYIYHQVMYVTGATGQGKSTQVPKLLLYALKAIDYKSNGKVVCTQPRIAPTTNNAKRIAEELGVPIEQSSNTSKQKIKTKYGYVQYKYQNDSHLDLNNNYFLRIVTDGSLYEEIKENVVMKTKSSINNKYTNTNIYDIIIVDEAHEHNINMDLIIALAKQTCYLNNDVKLIIVSATMDDDEPIYRRYFYDINDNLMQPIKSLTRHPFLPFNKFLPNPMYMDRRYHISPPGETTQYKVDEFYLDYDPIVYENGKINETKSAKMAQNLGYETILDICTKSSSGEILFFANGKGEILEAVEYLNKILPPGNIALPYFAELNSNYKDIIEKIDIKISSIKNKRENIHIEWGENYIEDYSVPNNIYKRSIIIATNVAEASVTINGLAYVVDNGYAKVNKYSPKLNFTKLEVEKISEASRKQRKGRVGRVGDGSVYYMYKRDSRKYIKPKCKITQEDITLKVLELLCEKSLDDIPINDIMNFNRLIINPTTNPNIADFKTKEKNNLIDNGLLELYQNNYSSVEPEHYQPDISENMSSIYFIFNSGQLINNLVDLTGQFYLVHPYEDIIERNINNDIIKYRGIKTNAIDSTEFIYLFTKLINMNLVIDFNAENVLSTSIYNKYKERIFVKTELVKHILQIKTLLSLDNIEDCLTVFTSHSMGCFYEIIELIIFIELLGLKKMTELPNENIDWKNFKDIYGNSNVKSDIIFIYELIKSFKNQFSELLVFNINGSYFKYRFDNIVEDNIDKFKKYNDMGYTEPPKNFDAVLWNKLFTKNRNGELDKDKNKVFRTDKSISDIVNSNLKKYEKQIIKWSNNNYINPKIFLIFLNRLSKFYLSIDFKQIDPNDSLNIKNPLAFASLFKTNFTKVLTTNTIEEKIIRSFMYGRPSQFTFLLGTYNYISILNTQKYFVFFASPYFPNQPTETLTNLSNQLTFYLKYNDLTVDNRNVINGYYLNQVELKWIISALPLFVNPINSFDIEINTVLNYGDIITHYDGYSINMLKKETINLWNKELLVWNSEYAPILQIYYSNIYKSMST